MGMNRLRPRDSVGVREGKLSGGDVRIELIKEGAERRIDNWL
jgi:hypothetical protein